MSAWIWSQSGGLGTAAAEEDPLDAEAVGPASSRMWRVPQAVAS